MNNLRPVPTPDYIAVRTTCAEGLEKVAEILNTTDPAEAAILLQLAASLRRRTRPPAAGEFELGRRTGENDAANHRPRLHGKATARYSKSFLDGYDAGYTAAKA